MDSQLAEAITRLYTDFERYPRPQGLAVCPMCAAAHIDPDQLARADTRAWSDAGLVGIHVLSLPDDALRHFLPRVFEVLLSDHWAAFEFGLNGLKGRTSHWPLAERGAIDNVLKTVWVKLLSTYPYCPQRTNSGRRARPAIEAPPMSHNETRTTPKGLRMSHQRLKGQT